MSFSPFQSAATLGAVLLYAAGGTPASGEAIDVQYGEPTLDRWMYPFNGNPGGRGEASVFSSLEIPEFNQFDDRDGQVLLGYATFADVPPGLPASSYTITSARLVIMIQSDLTFAYDPSYDSYRTYLPAGDPDAETDTDVGRPVILSGANYRNQFVTEPFPENGPFDNIPGEDRRERNVFPVNTFGGGDISNNVLDRFEAEPFAVGQVAGLAPGSSVANRTDMTFDLDVDSPAVQQYLQEALSAGRLDLVISSLHLTEAFGGADTYPVFYMRENFAVPTTASPARLDLSVVVQQGVPGDANGDGIVNVNDLVQVVTDWGPCPAEGPCPADLNCDLVVDVNDLVTVIVNWS